MSPILLVCYKLPCPWRVVLSSSRRGLGWWTSSGSRISQVEAGQWAQITMNGSRETRTRWKGKHASERARGDPISAIYETMKGWEAPHGLFADSAVLLRVNEQQAQLLSRACFGRFYPPLAVQPASSASTCTCWLRSITSPCSSRAREQDLCV